MAILYFVGGSNSLGFSELISAFIIYACYRSYNYCYLFIYIWFLISNIMQHLYILELVFNTIIYFFLHYLRELLFTIL